MDGVALATLEHRHVAELAQLRARNAEDIRISSAGRGVPGFTVADIERSLSHRIEHDSPEVHPFVVMAEGSVVGDLNLSQIIRGPEESANVGVLIDRERRGKGLAKAAIAVACRLAFEDLALHRLHVGIQPDNIASQRAFLHNGFEEIGLARGYLFVNGAWRDHVLMQKLAP